ncbi:acyl-CoA dehydrogenase family protein [Streptomyces sp. NPDC004539]|uniref:acyl-CoA dehydrogenase family protein n=1 Tax=Streptomyces sp. NPDC004539 TaxID=3154280 RepID=UPI0033A1F2A3
MDVTERGLLEETLRKALATGTGLGELGWPEMLDEEGVVPLLFRLLGETGAWVPVVNDVVLREAGRELGGTAPLPFAGGGWVEWGREAPFDVRRVSGGSAVPLGDGRRALGWWLLGTGHAMLGLARQHVLDREQFGRPLASFQALRHRLAETYVALEGAEAALEAADGDTGALLGKAAAGRAALLAARHCQQALGGIGFTAEHALHRHVKRALVLDGLLGSARELTREAGELLLREGRAPRLVDL